MAQKPTKKASRVQARHAGIETIPSFVFPVGQARDKDLRGIVAQAYGTERASAHAPSRASIKDSLGERSGRSLAESYSYGGRSYPSFEAAKAAHPDMQLISAPDPSDPGRRAAQLDKALGYSKNAHDAFAAMAEAGGGKVAKRAFAPLGYALDAAGAGARFVASQQRGEPMAVGLVRSAAPVVGGLVGGTGGAVVGVPLGAAAGSALPGLGTAAGALLGGIAGGWYGSSEGSRRGEEIADAYARKRRYRR